MFPFHFIYSLVNLRMHAQCKEQPDGWSVLFKVVFRCALILLSTRINTGDPYYEQTIIIHDSLAQEHNKQMKNILINIMFDVLFQYAHLT